MWLFQNPRPLTIYKLSFNYVEAALSYGELFLDPVSRTGGLLYSMDIHPSFYKPLSYTFIHDRTLIHAMNFPNVVV